jgi:hypothetical protein
MVLKTDEIICWRLQSLGSGVTYAEGADTYTVCR